MPWQGAAGRVPGRSLRVLLPNWYSRLVRSRTKTDRQSFQGSFEPVLSGSLPHGPRCPAPGEPSPGFIAEPGRCWRMVYSHQLQATHCREAPAWTGRWFSPKGDRWFQVWACPGHLEGLTGLRQFGSMK